MVLEVRNNVEYLNDDEVEQFYNWNYNKMSYFQKVGLITSEFFTGDRRRYWSKINLEAVKNREPVKRGPKTDALNNQRVSTDANMGVFASGRLLVLT